MKIREALMALFTPLVLGGKKSETTAGCEDNKTTKGYFKITGSTSLHVEVALQFNSQYIPETLCSPPTFSQGKLLYTNSGLASILYNGSKIAIPLVPKKPFM